MKSLAFSICLIFQYIRLSYSDDLIAVTALINHGDIIPAQFYPNDPHQDLNIWDRPSGQLSNLGEQQSYQIGKWLKHRYEEKLPFLSVQYKASEIYTYSENRDPSLMSGECLMAGLYPPVGEEIWNKKIDWRPTPVHNSPLFLDNTIGRGAFCPKYYQELQKVEHGRYSRTINKENRSLLKYLSEKTGEKFVNISQIPALYEILKIEENQKLALPNWTIPIHPDVLENVVLDLSVLRTKNPTLTKLSIGPFFDEILQQFQAIINNDPIVGSLTHDIRKFKTYVGNNTLFYDTLHALKVQSVGIIPSASALIFELHKTNNGLNYVKLLYKNGTEQNNSLNKLQIKGCKGVKCSYTTFNNTLQNYAVNHTQWTELCKL